MGIKTKLASWLIEKKLKSTERSVRISNLENAQTAGVIWNCDDQDAYHLLVSKLKEKNIRVSGFCFSDQPVSIKGEAVFSKQDFNWLGQPKTTEVLKFIETRFDLLVDISLSGSHEAKVVRALSRAKFKAGWSNSEPNYFDFGIDVSKQPEPGFLAEQIIHYLNELNKKTE